MTDRGTLRKGKASPCILSKETWYSYTTINQVDLKMRCITTRGWFIRKKDLVLGMYNKDSMAICSEQH